MQSATATRPSPHLDDFAGVLAGFARPAVTAPVAQSENGFEDDIATLSYASALGAQTVAYVPEKPAARAAEAPVAEVKEDALVSSPAPGQLTLKRPASVSLRLTVEEKDLVRMRAAKAETTVSAYVRSCIFEMEALRAQVKEMMTELKLAAATQALLAAKAASAQNVPALQKQPVSPSVQQPVAAPAPQRKPQMASQLAPVTSKRRSKSQGWRGLLGWMGRGA